MSFTTRKLTPHTTLGTLRRQAKRWLKEIEAGDPPALARFRSGFPNHAGKPGLREVQHALSREYGATSWAGLKQDLADREIAARGHAERVTLFLEKSALRYGVTPGTQTWGEYEADRPARGATARRILARHPEIAGDSIHTAVAASDIEAVRRQLETDATLARHVSGFDGWTPLLRLAYTRMPADANGANEVDIARLLLEHGASVSDFWSDGSSHFTALTGVIGGGESSQPPHPQAEALAHLLIEHGADPLDGPALYNTSLGADDTFWLQLLWDETEKRGETARWRGPVRELNGPALDYLLGNAVPLQPRRAEWLLAHGARAETTNSYSKQSVVKQAMVNGREDLVDLLTSHGAPKPELTGHEAFVSAIASGNEAAARQLLAGRPDYRLDPAPLNIAIRQGRRDIAERALALGVSPDAETRDGVRPLHEAAGSGQTEIAALLISAGAAIDPVERRFGSTPLGWAHHNGADEVTSYLAALSEDICGLCRSASLPRLDALLAQNPGLANAATRTGEPPLFTLPDDDENAIEVAETLLAAGADAKARNSAGLTPAEAARKQGLFGTVSLLDGDGQAA
jgi:ankyrin repeat protein